MWCRASASQYSHMERTCCRTFVGGLVIAIARWCDIYADKHRPTTERPRLDEPVSAIRDCLCIKICPLTIAQTSDTSCASASRHCLLLIGRRHYGPQQRFVGGLWMSFRCCRQQNSLVCRRNWVQSHANGGSWIASYPVDWSRNYRSMPWVTRISYLIRDIIKVEPLIRLNLQQTITTTGSYISRYTCRAQAGHRKTLQMYATLFQVVRYENQLRLQKIKSP